MSTVADPPRPTASDVDQPARPKARRRVVIAYKSLPAYRIAFFEGLREALADDGIELTLVHGDPTGEDRLKRDASSLPWASYRPNRTLNIGGRVLVWQPIGGVLRGADLVIVEQASKLLLNYLLLARQRVGLGPRVAFWGHGANLNPRTRSGPSELLKRKYSTLSHWWFAYTDGSRRRVMALGYPGERVTVVQNASDTEQLRDQLVALDPAAVQTFRERTGCAGPTGLFIGSLYEDKRLPFLIEAARRIHAAEPSFVLLIAGDGPTRGELVRTAGAVPYVRWLGRVDGEERLLALAAADCILMPGLVGLAILDAFAAESPLVTTSLECHSPEIEYLEPNENGLLVDASDDPQAYADAVVTLLRDEQLRARLKAGCRVAASTYTTKAMVQRFRGGVLAALGMD